MHQRTVITVIDKDHHRFEIYFTPPGGKERLIDARTIRGSGERVLADEAIRHSHPSADRRRLAES